MDVAQLPEEIFIEIFSYLSAYDLISCSLVNTSWRNAINYNEIWQNVCKSSIVSINFEELNYSQSLVTDTSTEPYSACGFEPLCKWRKTFMKWEKLKQNWRNCKFKSFEIDERFNSIYDLPFSEYNNDILILTDNKSRRLSVWDLKGVPTHKEVINFSLYHVTSEFVKLFNDLLVIVQCTLLQVYKLTSENQFCLLYRCIFDRNESAALPQAEDLTDWYRSNIDLYPCDLTIRCEHNGKKFVGFILDPNHAVMHIWDLNETSKIETPIPQTSGSVQDITFSVEEDCLYLLLKEYTQFYYQTLYAYDLKYSTFLDLKLLFNDVIGGFLFHKKLIIVLNGKSVKCLNIWNNTGKFITTISCDDKKILRKNVDIIGSHLVLVSTHSSGEHQNAVLVSVYNVNNFKEIYSAEEINMNVEFLFVIQNTFLILNGHSYYHCLSVLSVSDIVKHCKLYTVRFHDCIFVNKFHSKMLIRVGEDRHLRMVSFW